MNINKGWIITGRTTAYILAISLIVLGFVTIFLRSILGGFMVYLVGYYLIPLVRRRKSAALANFNLILFIAAGILAFLGAYLAWYADDSLRQSRLRLVGYACILASLACLWYANRRAIQTEASMTQASAVLLLESGETVVDKATNWLFFLLGVFWLLSLSAILAYYNFQIAFSNVFKPLLPGWERLPVPGEEIVQLEAVKMDFKFFRPVFGDFFKPGPLQVMDAYVRTEAGDLSVCRSGRNACSVSKLTMEEIAANPLAHVCTTGPDAQVVTLAPPGQMTDSCAFMTLSDYQVPVVLLADGSLWWYPPGNYSVYNWEAGFFGGLIGAALGLILGLVCAIWVSVVELKR